MNSTERVDNETLVNNSNSTTLATPTSHSVFLSTTIGQSTASGSAVVSASFSLGAVGGGPPPPQGDNPKKALWGELGQSDTDILDK